MKSRTLREISCNKKIPIFVKKLKFSLKNRAKTSKKKSKEEKSLIKDININSGFTGVRKGTNPKGEKKRITTSFSHRDFRVKNSKRSFSNPNSLVNRTSNRNLDSKREQLIEKIKSKGNYFFQYKPIFYFSFKLINFFKNSDKKFIERTSILSSTLFYMLKGNKDHYSGWCQDPENFKIENKSNLTLHQKALKYMEKEEIRKKKLKENLNKKNVFFVDEKFRQRVNSKKYLMNKFKISKLGKTLSSKNNFENSILSSSSSNFCFQTTQNFNTKKRRKNIITDKENFYFKKDHKRKPNNSRRSSFNMFSNVTIKFGDERSEEKENTCL